MDDLPWPFFASSLADCRCYKHSGDVNATSTQQHFATTTYSQQQSEIYQQYDTLEMTFW